MKSTPINLNFGTLAIPATSTLNSQPITISQAFGFSVQVFWTGTPVGNWTLQGSCDAGYIEANGTVTGVSHWSTIANSTVAAGGAAGDFVVNYEGSYFRWVRVVYTASSSTGTITSAVLTTKGV